LIAVLSKSKDPRVGPALSAAFGQFPPEVQAATFEVLLQRPEWTMALIEAAKAGKTNLSGVGPAGIARLRTHPNKDVSKRANAVLDELFGPALQAKNEVIAKLTPEVEKPGDAVKGKAQFTATCAICHRLGDLGADIGPALTGMGAHGPAELLVHIVDPNREVDPSFTAWNIETQNGQNYAGVIARENSSMIVLKSPAGEQEISVSEIKSRVNTGRSLMPEGFEGLGAENLRDLLAYICGGDAQRFRLVDFKSAFTADSRQVVFNQPKAAKGGPLPFKKSGSVTFDGVPFLIVDPAKSLNGNNVVILKGGPEGSFTKTLPQRVEARLDGFKANRLHFLGGINGWGANRGEGAGEVMKITVHYTDGQTEEIVCKNGFEFADDLAGVEALGSKATDLVDSHQLRYFSKQLERTAPIEKIVLESFDNNAAPTTVAITAELAGP
jgi:putative heme-binding domain-containing protein